MPTISNKKTLQLLRNSVIYESKSAAKNALESANIYNQIEDGMPVIARYKIGTDGIGAILGIKNTINNGSSNITKVVIFDNAEGTDITTAIEALDVSAVGGSGKIITTISETDGKISATAVDADTDHLTTKGVTSINNGTTLTSALNTIYTAATTGSAVSLTSAAGTGNVLTTYTLSQNGTTVGTINIPKDLVVQSGSVVSGTWSGTTFTPGTGTGSAIKLVIANQTDPIYINTASLVDVYTNGNGLNLNSGTFSIKIDSNSNSLLTVGSGGLKLDAIKMSDVTTSSAISAAQSYTQIVANDSVATAFSKLYKGIEDNRTNISKITVTNSDSSITVTPPSGNGTTDIKVNIVDCGTYTIS